MNYFDTHFHLTAMQDKGIDLDSLRGIEGMDIGCDPGDIVRRIEVIRKFPSLYFSQKTLHRGSFPEVPKHRTG